MRAWLWARLGHGLPRRLPDGLAGRGARREAVEVGSLRVEHRREVAGGHVRLLLHLGERVQRLEAEFRELRHVERVALDRRHHHPREGGEVLLPFAAAEIDAEPPVIRE